MPLDSLAIDSAGPSQPCSNLLSVKLDRNGKLGLHVSVKKDTHVPARQAPHVASSDFVAPRVPASSPVTSLKWTEKQLKQQSSIRRITQQTSTPATPPAPPTTKVSQPPAKPMSPYTPSTSILTSLEPARSISTSPSLATVAHSPSVAAPTPAPAPEPSKTHTQPRSSAETPRPLKTPKSSQEPASSPLTTQSTTPADKQSSVHTPKPPRPVDDRKTTAWWRNYRNPRKSGIECVDPRGKILHFILINDPNSDDPARPRGHRCKLSISKTGEFLFPPDTCMTFEEKAIAKRMLRQRKSGPY